MVGITVFDDQMAAHLKMAVGHDLVDAKRWKRARVGIAGTIALFGKGIVHFAPDAAVGKGSGQVVEIATKDDRVGSGIEQGTHFFGLFGSLPGCISDFAKNTEDAFALFGVIGWRNALEIRGFVPFKVVRLEVDVHKTHSVVGRYHIGPNAGIYRLVYVKRNVALGNDGVFAENGNARMHVVAGEHDFFEIATFKASFPEKAVGKASLAPVATAVFLQGQQVGRLLLHEFHDLVAGVLLELGCEATFIKIAHIVGHDLDLARTLVLPESHLEHGVVGLPACQEGDGRHHHLPAPSQCPPHHKAQVNEQQGEAEIGQKHQWPGVGWVDIGSSIHACREQACQHIHAENEVAHCLEEPLHALLFTGPEQLFFFLFGETIVTVFRDFIENAVDDFLGHAVAWDGLGRCSRFGCRWVAFEAYP